MIDISEMIETSAKVFDIGVMKDSVGDDEDTLKMLLSLLDEQLDQYKKELEVALEKEDKKEISVVAHTIKGMAGNAGGLKLYDIALVLEKQAKVLRIF